MVRVKSTPRRSLQVKTQNWAHHSIQRKGASSKPSSEWKPDTNGKKNLQHPLSVHPELPKLTEMQQLITQAILIYGEPCPFDKIYEYVNEKWKEMKIKRRDGAPYSTDCRRAIQANLRQGTNHMPLFSKDLHQAGHWRLVYTLDPSFVANLGSIENTLEDEEDSVGVKPFGRSSSGVRKEKRKAQSDAFASELGQLESESESESFSQQQGQLMLNRDYLHSTTYNDGGPGQDHESSHWAHGDPSSLSPSPSPPHSPGGHPQKVKREKDKMGKKAILAGAANYSSSSMAGAGPRTRARERLRSTVNSRQAAMAGRHILTNSELTPIQTLLSCAIEGSSSQDKRATVSQICEYSTKLFIERGWNQDSGGIMFDNQELRTAVISCLNMLDSYAPIFMRDPSYYTHWKFTQQHPWHNIAPLAKQSKIMQLYTHISQIISPTSAPPPATISGATSAAPALSPVPVPPLTSTPSNLSDFSWPTGVSPTPVKVKSEYPAGEMDLKQNTTTSAPNAGASVSTTPITAMNAISTNPTANSTSAGNVTTTPLSVPQPADSQTAETQHTTALNPTSHAHHQHQISPGLVVGSMLAVPHTLPPTTYSTPLISPSALAPTTVAGTNSLTSHMAMRPVSVNTSTTAPTGMTLPNRTALPVPTVMMSPSPSTLSGISTQTAQTQSSTQQTMGLFSNPQSPALSVPTLLAPSIPVVTPRLPLTSQTPVAPLYPSLGPITPHLLPSVPRVPQTGVVLQPTPASSSHENWRQ